MPVVVPIVAIGVALLVLLVAYALVVLFTPIIEGVLREIPFVGGVLAGKAKRALEWAAGKVVGYANAGVSTIEHWFHGLAASTRDFVDAVNAFIADLPDKLDHLTHVTVHEIVKAFVNPVRDAVHEAAADATDALATIAAIGDLPLSHFRGIEHGVDNKLGHLQDLIENVDLPDLHDVLERQLHGAETALGHRVDDVTGYVDEQFGRVWDRLEGIPLQQILEGLAAASVAGALVHVIANEAGLGRAECRSKVKQICATDPSAWSALLDVVGLTVEWVGIVEFVRLAQDFARESLPSMLELVRGR
jgi:hypothetical protein